MLAALMVGEEHPIVTARSGSVQNDGYPGGGAWGKGGTLIAMAGPSRPLRRVGYGQNNAHYALKH
jgi:hypothetical protein